MISDTHRPLTRLIALAGIAVLAAAPLTACGGSNNNNQANPTPTSTQTLAYPTCPELGGLTFIQEPGEAVTATIQSDCSVILQVIGQDATSTMAFTDGSFSGRNDGSVTWYTESLASYTYIPKGLLDSDNFPDAVNTAASVGIDTSELANSTWLYYQQAPGSTESASASATDTSSSAMLFRLQSGDDDATDSTSSADSNSISGTIGGTGSTSSASATATEEPSASATE